MAATDEDEVYCLCRRPYDPAEFMIECDICNDWFHGSCVGIEEYQASDIDSYHCPNCQPEHGPLTLKRRRNWHRHDYSEINDGKKAVQSGTVVFVNKLKQRRFPDAGDGVLLRLKGSEVTVNYFERNGFKIPIIVEQKEGLGLRVPPSDFRISDVERYVGSMRELDVIDVARQDDITMRMREWTEYYENERPRDKVLNVISLEFSGTDLARLVTPPTVVRKIDWIETHWPETLPEDSLLSRPLVQKYCLMGVKDSYTDFHVDFGGTSVWYHVVRGEKVFYLIPPTEENLIRYEEWVMSSNQSEMFFGDLVPQCYICTVRQGNTLFIPTGWIHAVLTPQDSLVFGGNFLHRFGITMQLRIYEMELRLDTPIKFRHPCYEALTWFAAKDYITELKSYSEKGIPPPIYLLEGMKEMLYCFSRWTRSRESLKSHGAQIPHDIRPSSFVDQLSRTISQVDHMPPDIGRTRSEGRQGNKRQRREGDNPDLTSSKGKRRKSLTMKLSTSESRVIGHSEDKEKQRISMKLTVPEVKVVSNSLTEEETSSTTSSWAKDDTMSSDEEGRLSITADKRVHPESQAASTRRPQRRPQLWKRKPVKEEEERGEGVELEQEGEESRDKEYEDEDFVYPSLVSESDATSAGRRGQQNKDDDELWTPQGSVKLLKGSVASSPREKRNARKRSFEQCMSATAAKILKMEQERETSAGEKVQPVPVAKVSPINPVPGGGALKIIGEGGSGINDGGNKDNLPTQRARATAAANAVDAVLAASRPKSKLLTPKQRLGKIMGLGRSGRWKV